METVIKMLLITIWLFSLLYFSFPKKDELIEQYVIKNQDSHAAIDTNIKQYSLFLIFNALIVTTYGLYNLSSYPDTGRQMLGIVLVATGLVMCIGAYGIWQKYQWGRAMTPMMLIMTTIILLSTTNLNNNYSFLGSTTSIYSHLEPYYNPVSMVDLGLYIIKVGYFAVVSVVTVRFLEKPRIKAFFLR